MRHRGVFTTSILKQYAGEKSLPLRSVADLSPFEKWLIDKMFNSTFAPLSEEMIKRVFTFQEKKIIDQSPEVLTPLMDELTNELMK